MAKQHIVKCRLCHQQFDTEGNEDWVMPSKNFYYHKTCYEDWARKKNNVHSEAEETLWFDAVWQYLKKDLKIGPDYIKISSQWENFLKKGMTPKGIYFCLRYFYEVKKGDKSKADHGIGIIPHIYQDGASYWQIKEVKEKGICDRIEQQMKEARARDTIALKKPMKNQKKRKGISLDSIADMESED